jgi:hypothetical protein
LRFSATSGWRIACWDSAGAWGGGGGEERKWQTGILYSRKQWYNRAIQWIPGAFSLGVKRLGREADHSPPSSAVVKNAWSYTSIRPIRLHGVVLS